MWAMLDENDLLVNGNPVQIFRRPQPMTFTEAGEEYQAPANWMQLWTLQEKNDRHIFPLVVGNIVDSSVERSAGDPTYTFDGTNITETIPVQDLTLAGYQSVKMRELTAKRDAEIVQNIFITFGQELAFSAEDAVTSLMFDVMTAVNGGMTFPANFKWSTVEVRNELDVVTHPLIVQTINETQARTVAEAMLLQKYNANKQFIELRQDVTEAISRAEVDAVVWV